MEQLLTCRVPALPGKKEIVVGSKVSQAEYDLLQWICDSRDRSMSYVLRELAMRGLASYFRDANLRTTEEEDEIIQRGRKFSARDGNGLLPLVGTAKNELEPADDVPKTRRKKA